MFKKALVLLLTLCMIVSIMAPAASAVQGLVSGADTKGSSSGVSQLNPSDSTGPATLKDQLLENQNTLGTNKGSLASEALGQLKNEALEELKRAAEVFAPKDVVAAFVVLETDPTSELYADINAVPANTTRAMLAVQKAMLDKIRAEITAESTLTVRYQFTYLMNAFSINTEFENLSKIAELPGVRTVFIMPEYQALSVETKTAVSGSMTGVPSVWADCGYTGTGMRIAIIDTGLDLDHPSFAEIPEGTSLTVDEINGVLQNLNAYKMMYLQGISIDGEDLYYSGKIPFAFNYSDWNLNADHASDAQGDHGTHVAGIAAANRVEGVDSVGMAPDAQVIVMKVFGNQGSMMDGVIAALEDALILNCDVANLSLGSSAGFSSTSTVIDEVFNRIREQDMIVAVAAGNEYTSGLYNSWGLHLNTTDNPDNATVDAPGTYLNSTTVASVENGLMVAPFFTYGDGVRVGYRNTNGIPLFSKLAELGEVEYVFVPGLGTEADYAEIDVQGKIALVNRGDITFQEKMQNAAEAGAVGVLIVNNAPGSVLNFGMDFTGVTEPIVPCVMISLENGEAMAAAEKYVLTVSDVEGLVPSENGGQMSEFTSWGVSPDLRLLPHIAGVGGNITSTVDPEWTGEGGYYGLMSGTSMATPQVAGISALVLQYLQEKFPDITDAERRVMADALLMSTSVPVRNATTGVEASPRQQGSGLVNAIGAVTSGAYLSVSYDTFGSMKPQIELGDDPDKNGVYTFTFNVNNFSDADKTYTLSGSLLTEEVYEYYGVKFMDGTDRALTGDVEFDVETVVVPAGGSAKITVKVTLSEEDKAWMDENYPNGIYVEGYVYLTAEEGGVDLSLPYMGFYGDWNQAPIFDSGFWYENSMWGIPSEDGMPNVTHTEHVLWTKLADTDWVLGINPYTGYYDESLYDSRNNVVSPNGDGYIEGIEDIYLSLLRNAAVLSYTFTDENGNVLSYIEDPLCKKTLYMLGYGMTVPYVYSWSGIPMYDFTDAYGNLLPDGTTVTLTIKAETDYGNGGVDVNKSNTLSFPITVDVTGPQLEECVQFVGEDGRNYITLNITDASSLAYVVLANPAGTRYLDSQLDAFHFTRNNDENNWSITFDVTGYGSDMSVILCDYGANESNYAIEFTAADNMPEVEMDGLFGYRVYDDELYYAGYYDYMYGWHAINKETAELTEQANDRLEYYAITAADYVDGLIFAVDAGNNLLWMEPGLWNRHHITNLGAYIVDMTFDETTGTMYALAKEEDPFYGSELITLYMVDLLTGDLTPVAQYDLYADYYYQHTNAPYCITDVNGELYVGIYYSTQMAKLNENFEIEVLLDYKEEEIQMNRETYYAQSMTYDASTNSIYWAHYSYTDSAFVTIDLTYAEVNDFIVTEEPMPGNAEMVALFVVNEMDYQLPESTEVQRVELDQYNLLLQVGESGTLTPATLPWNAPVGELTWSSSDETVATVDNGVVTAVGEGKAIVTVTDGTNSAECEVRVVEITGAVYGYNYYAATTDGQYAWGTWFELTLEDMDINATHSGMCPVFFMAADYNGHAGLVYGYDEYGQFWSYDPATNTAVALGSPIPQSAIPYDMAYDYSTGIMYASILGNYYGESCGALATVDMNNGTLTQLQINYIADPYGGAYPDAAPYATLAWSPNGLLGITQDGRLMHITTTLMYETDWETWETITYEILAGTMIMEGLGYPFYYQSMCYDHANDKLVWPSVENGTVYWIDPWDPAVIALGQPQGLAMFEFVGMYTIPENIEPLPYVPVESITAENMTLVTNASKPSSLTIYPSNATNTTATFVSSDENVAVVDANGNVVGVAPGVATITVTIVDGDNTITTSFDVTVLQGTGTINAHLAGDISTNASQVWLWFEDSDPTYMEGQYCDLYYYSAEYCAETGYIYAYGYDPSDWSGRWFFVTLDTEWNVVDQKVMSQNFPFVYDMTYNYADGIMYAVADVTDQSSDLYMVNLSTGELLPAMELVDDYGNEMCFLSLAASPDGKLYAIANSTVEMDWWTYQEVVMPAMMYELDPVNNVMTPVCSTGFNHNMLGSMAFDMDTGNLYWASCYNSGAGYDSNLCMINLEDGMTEFISLGIPNATGALLSGMYILAEEYPEYQPELNIIAGLQNMSAFVGQQLNPNVIVTGTTNAVVWTSGNTDVVSVDAEGTITAVAPGVTTLTGTVTDTEGNTKSVMFGVTIISSEAYFLGYNNKTNTWEKISRVDPTQVTPIEESLTETTLWVAEVGNGVIYAYDVEGNFYAIDPVTFESTKIGGIELSGTFNEIRDLAWDSVNGRLLALIADDMMFASVYEVNLAFGSVSKLVDIVTYDSYGNNLGGEQVNGITVGLDGTVYVLDSYPNFMTQDSINVLDMTTGELTFLNSLNRVSVYTDNYAQMAMTTDPLTGVIYILSTSNENYYNLSSFNPDNLLVEDLGHVSKTEKVDDEWGWTTIIGNTYNALISVDVHTHAYVGEVQNVTAGDCSIYKATSQHCLMCGDVLTVIADHDYSVFVETVAADCVNAGYDVYKCSDANCECTMKTNFTAALGHTPDGVADCVTDVSCSVCGELLEVATGHDMVINDSSITCPGTYDATCSVCGEAGTTTISGRHTIYVCEGAGAGYIYSNDECDICGATLRRYTYVNKVALGHNNPNGENVTDCTAGFDCDRCNQYVAGHKQHCFDRVIVEADCDTDGSRTYSCVRCEVVKTFVVDAYGHEVEGEACEEGLICAVCGEMVEPAVAHTPGDPATCTTAQVCTVCGQVLVAANGHAPMTVPGYAATCTEPGMSDGIICSVCGTWLLTQRVTPTLGHAFVIEEGKEATCTESGLTEGKYCSRCQVVLSEQEVIDALGHTEVIDEAVAATCTTAGLTEGKRCSTCNEVLVAQEVIPALGHTEVVDAGTAATCTAEGITEGKHCSVCNEVLVAQEVIPAAGHKFSSWALTKGATCTEPGEGTRTCSKCGEVETREIRANGHGFGAWTVTTEPTCTTEGVETRTCACGEAETRSIGTKADAHVFGEWTVAKEATTKEAGEETRTCACGETETREIPMLPAPETNTGLIVAIVVIVVAGAAVAVFFFLKKKRA